MKKSFLLIVSCCLFACVTFAQSSSVAPKDYKSQTINSLLLREASNDHYDGSINIPVYLTSARDVTIEYCWYKTAMQWGNCVRVSEEPVRVEQGTYVNGRLTDYKTAKFFYNIEWSPTGIITRINKYDKDGKSCGTYALPYGWYWTDYETIELEGKGLTSPSSVHIRNTLVKEKTWCGFYGFCFSSGQLIHKRTQKELMKVDGQLAKKWVDTSWESVICKFNPDGSMCSSSCFDFNNSSKCACFEL